MTPNSKIEPVKEFLSDNVGVKKADFEFGSITTQSQAFIDIDFTVKMLN